MKISFTAESIKTAPLTSFTFSASPHRRLLEIPWITIAADKPVAVKVSDHYRQKLNELHLQSSERDGMKSTAEISGDPHNWARCFSCRTLFIWHRKILLTVYDVFFYLCRGIYDERLGNVAGESSRLYANLHSLLHTTTVAQSLIYAAIVSR